MFFYNLVRLHTRNLFMPIDPRFTDVFVSHSSRDSAYAAETVSFLKACFELKDYEIACTSHPIYGVSGGEEYEKNIRVSIDKCKIFIALLSESSLCSVFCTMEMGAAWGQKKTFKPILLPSLLSENVPRPLSSMNLLRWQDQHAWQQLAQDVHLRTATKRRQQDMWGAAAKAVATFRPTGAA